MTFHLEGHNWLIKVCKTDDIQAYIVFSVN